MSVPSQSFDYDLDQVLPFAQSLIARLRELGHQVVSVPPGPDYAGAEDYRRLFRDLEAGGLLPDKLLYAWTLVEGQALPGDDFSALLLALQAWQTSPRPGDLIVLSNELHDVVGERPRHPQRATVFGLAEVAAQEYPQLTSRCLDIQLPAGPELAEDVIGSHLKKKPEDVTVKVTPDVSSGIIWFQNQQAIIDSFRIQRRASGDIVYSGRVEANTMANINPLIKEKGDNLSCCYYIVMVTIKKEELLQKLFLY